MEIPPGSYRKGNPCGCCPIKLCRKRAGDMQHTLKCVYSQQLPEAECAVEPSAYICNRSFLNMAASSMFHIIPGATMARRLTLTLAALLALSVAASLKAQVQVVVGTGTNISWIYPYSQYCYSDYYVYPRKLYTAILYSGWAIQQAGGMPGVISRIEFQAAPIHTMDREHCASSAILGSASRCTWQSLRIRTFPIKAQPTRRSSMDGRQ